MISKDIFKELFELASLSKKAEESLSEKWNILHAQLMDLKPLINDTYKINGFIITPNGYMKGEKKSDETPIQFYTRAEASVIELINILKKSLNNNIVRNGGK